MSQQTEAIVILSLAVLSAVALVFILLRTIRLVTRLFLKRVNVSSSTPDILFFRTRIGHYVGCLILSNIFFTFARLIDFRWLSHSPSSEGSACSTQAVLMQIGIWGVSWFTTAHSVHVLCSLVFHIPQARWHTAANIILGWTSALVAGLAPLYQRDMYGPVRGSCTITTSHPIQTFALQLFPIILASIVSTTVYAIMFIVFHRNLSTHKIQTKQRGGRPEEYYQYFIVQIIRSMFLFPLAFVLLFFPFCIAHVLLVAGCNVPIVVCVFADVCVSVLGLVNVGLLCNTLRVIKNLYGRSRGVKGVEETVKTFGNDASGESPIVPSRTYNFKRSSPNHVTWTRVNSNSRLVRSEKPLPALPPAALDRHLGGIPNVVLPLNIKKKRVVEFQFKADINLPSHEACLDPCTPRASLFTEDSQHPSSTHDVCSSQPVVPSGTSSKRPSFRSKAPAALNLSRFSVESLTSVREVSSKSAILAARLGIRAAPTSASSPTPTVDSFRRLDKGKGRALVAPIPQQANESELRPTSSISTDSDTDYSAEILHARKVRPLPLIPEPNVTAPQDLDNRSAHHSITTLWSQESGDTLSKPEDAQRKEASRKKTVDMLSPEAWLLGQTDVGGSAMSGEATPHVVALRPFLLRPGVALKLSPGLPSTVVP